MRRPVSPELIDKRNKIIIQLLEAGIASTKIGRALSISRERVCQIMFATTGKSIRQLRLEEKINQVNLEELKRKRFCIVCGGELFGKCRRFCTKACHMKFFCRRRRRTPLVCDGCGITFYPWYTTKYRKGKGYRHFHDQECYFKSRFAFYKTKTK